MSVIEQIVGEVHGHSMAVDSELIYGWTKDVWSEVNRFRTWSYLRRRTALVIPAHYSTGTATFTPGSTTVTFSGATLTLGMIGRQIRRGVDDAMIYDITSVDTSANTLQIWPAWNTTTTTVSAQSYVIFTAYISPPADFFAWLSVADPPRRNRLRLHVAQDTIDFWDAKRSTGTYPACLSGIDWSRSYSGRVYPTLRVVGAGPTPTASGNYTGQADGLLVVTITLGGAVETATFSWRIDDGTSMSGNGTTTSDPEGTVLPLGIALTWPAGTYVLNNVFVVRLSSQSTSSLPRYEIYPHPTTALMLPALYSTYTPDIESESFVLPRPIDLDVLKTGVLAKMARQYPGTDNKSNPFSQIGRAQALETEFGAKLMQCAVQDDWIIETNVMDGWPEAPLPWIGSSGWQQSQTEDQSARYGIY